MCVCVCVYVCVSVCVCVRVRVCVCVCVEETYDYYISSNLKIGITLFMEPWLSYLFVIETEVSRLSDDTLHHLLNYISSS